ncbi:steroid 17-alpha-hydroxylase/17,20 lyase-like [Hydra vulgaris]|uniref:Steroid 17-alpha-hydroxylase/17,20 lyase-like n=1 Tax=Hydra vulgaris TaxID=6087 RepID=A0ABM4BK02_HYDVU
MWLEIFYGIVSPILLYIMVPYIRHLLECRKYPVGPFPLPVIGNFLSLGLQPHQTLAEYSKKYGNIFSISFGMKRVVIISEINATREALVQKATNFAGRPLSYAVQLATRGYKVITFMDYGPLWKNLRKIVHSSLTFYGEKSESFESLLIKESEELHRRLLQKSKKPTELKTEFGAAIANVISFIVFGKRYQYSDSAFKEILTMINQLFAGVSNTSSIDFLPWLRYLPFTKIKEFKITLSKYFLFLNKELKVHKETYDENNIRDYVDSIIKFSKDKTTKIKIEEDLNNEHLEHIIGDMFLGGVETTLTSLLWLTLYMIHYQEIQEEIFNEIIAIVGENRYPSLKDLDSLNLVKASINESLRLASVVPLGVPHKTMSETTLMGYSIPKNTTVIINHWQIHNDTNHWEKPEEFNPYRWINKDNIFDSSKATSYLPFSIGLRACLGKTMAEKELFFFFTRLIRDFKFEGLPGCPLPSLIGKCNITNSPDSFEVYLTPRINNLMCKTSQHHKHFSKNNEKE